VKFIRLIFLAVLLMGGLVAPRGQAQTFSVNARSSGSPAAIVTTAIATTVTVTGPVAFYITDNTLGGGGARILVQPGAPGYVFVNAGGFAAGFSLGTIQPAVTGAFDFTVIQSGSTVTVKSKVCPPGQAVNAVNDDGSVSCVVVASAGGVSSVFGRAGDVVAANNDYNFTQLAGGLAHSQLPTLLSGDIPNNAANTSGTAANVSGTPALPNGTTGTTQAALDNTTKLATDAFVLANSSRTVASGTQALATALIASGSCASTITVSATGALTTDNVLLDFTTDPTGVTGYVPATSGILTIFKWLTADTVNIKVCNMTSGSITPGAATLAYRVVR
jgi:hypothetical protein